MLRYKIKLNEPKSYNEIKCEEIYLSTDLSFISGVTDYSYGLIDGQSLKIEFNNDNKFHDVTVKIENVTRQGYVIINQTFEVETYDNIKMYRYVDGKYYSTNLSNEVTREVVYWVEDGKITIGDNEYKVDLQLDENGDPLYSHYIIMKGGKKLPINSCDKNSWKKVTKFLIRKNNDYELKLNAISCVKKVPYFLYNEGHDIDCGNETKMNEYIEKAYYLEYDKNTRTYHKLIGRKDFIQNFDKVKYSNEETNEEEIYNVKYEWRDTDNGEYLHLYLNMPQYNFTSAQRILVESTSSISTKCDLIWEGTTKPTEGKYIIYCGKKYIESKTNDTIDFLDIYGEEYKLTYTDTKKEYAYIEFYNDLIYIKIDGEKGIKLSQYQSISDSAKYDIKKYRYFNIDGDKFLIKSYSKVDVNYTSETTIDYVEIVKREKFILNIVEVVNNTMLKCIPDTGIDGDVSGISGIIASNFKRMTFKLINPLFEEHNITKESFALSEIRGVDEVYDSIKLFNPSSYVKIPLNIGNDFAVNSLQEDILKNIFAKEETKKAINPYIDMEREIYYPAYRKGNNVSLINELQFYLHFRSRDLNEWKINEDIFENEDRSNIKSKCNWNIFDSYDNYDTNNTSYIDSETNKHLRPEIKDDYDMRYYQPSDLLHFLNFTTDDVFYRKSKISKSFLRLLFFDSIDMANQTLLYSCTVFMNENKLYKTYIDNAVRNDNYYGSVSEDLNDKKVLTSKTISVYNDYGILEGEGTDEEKFYVTFGENKRLDASFSVKNRYESEESAEGFYLHIFKNYCEKLHEKTIYMKVEFNHAGEGRTINMLMPMKYDGDEPELMELGIGNQGRDVETFKKGYALDELYKHLFIPIKVVYNEENKKYIYYLPKGLAPEKYNNDKIMKFNLYELKIKDESYEGNT